MIVRQGISQDELGIWESMRDWSADNLGINVSAKFHVAFTSQREKLLSNYTEAPCHKHQLALAILFTIIQASIEQSNSQYIKFIGPSK